METTYRKKPQPLQYDIADDDDLYITRMPSSARRYRPTNTATQAPEITQTALVQRRRSNVTAPHTNSVPVKALVIPHTDELPAIARPRRNFKMAALVVGMAGTILLLMSFTMVQSWWQNYQDGLNYGYPRTSHLEAVVGHNDSTLNPTQFIFTNNHGHIEIIEIPGGDVSHTRAFNGPTLFGNGNDLVVPKGEIRLEHNKYDLIVHIQDQQIVFTNDGNTFHLT